jgi:cytochrome c
MPEDVDPAKQQFLTSCGVCHSDDPGAGARQGPAGEGIMSTKR